MDIESDISSEWSLDIQNIKLQNDDQSQYPKSKNEIIPKILEIQETIQERFNRFKIEKLENLVQCGFILNLVDKQTFIIQNQLQYILHPDTLLFTQNDILGKIDDIIGNIQSPLYTVFTDTYLNNLWQQNIIKNGDQIFMKQNSNIIQQQQIEKLLKQKGSDASNMFDEEIVQDEQEFSDDEKENQKKFKSDLDYIASCQNN